MGDLTLGSKLRVAREMKGMDISTAAEKTKILPQMLRELEGDDFHRIPAPIYAKGFIRTYCECLDIDPQPLIDEYMDKHNQGRDMKSATEHKMAKKKRPKIPSLSQIIPKSTLEKPQLIKQLIGLVVVIILIILISLIGRCSSTQNTTYSKDAERAEQIITTPQDVYLIQPGIVEAK